jgi:hypothetical protein
MQKVLSRTGDRPFKDVRVSRLPIAVLMDAVLPAFSQAIGEVGEAFP